MSNIGGDINDPATLGTLKGAMDELGSECVEQLEAFIQASIHCSEIDRKSLGEIFGVEHETDDDLDLAECALDAVELLAFRNSLKSLPLILRCFNWLEKYNQADMLSAAAPAIIANFSAEAVFPVMEFVVNGRGAETTKAVVLDCIREFGDRNPYIQSPLAPHLISCLENASIHAKLLNAMFANLASQWKMVEAAPAIERAFSNNLIDCSVTGNWEMVRQQLQVTGLNLPMPAQPFNSMAELRHKLGVGLFSDRPLLEDGEIDEDAVSQYLETVCQAFSESSEFQTLNLQAPYPGTVEKFLELAIRYLGAHAENMSLSDIEELLLDIFPRKISVVTDVCDELLDELVAFWKFCHRVYHLEKAAAFAEKTERLRSRFGEAMNDPRKFGMAKSMFMAGHELGYDMTSDAEIREFIAYLNATPEPLSSPAHTFEPWHLTSQPIPLPPQTEAAPAHLSLKQRKKLLEQRMNKRR